jgi:hypothetical protein
MKDEDKNLRELLPVVSYPNPITGLMSPSAEAVLASKRADLAYDLLRGRDRVEHSVARNRSIYGALSSAASAQSQEVIALIQSRGPEDNRFYLDTVTSVEPEHSKSFPGFGTRVMVKSSTRGGWHK